MQAFQIISEYIRRVLEFLRVSRNFSQSFSVSQLSVGVSYSSGVSQGSCRVSQSISKSCRFYVTFSETPIVSRESLRIYQNVLGVCRVFSEFLKIHKILWQTPTDHCSIQDVSWSLSQLIGVSQSLSKNFQASRILSQSLKVSICLLESFKFLYSVP